MTKFRSYDADDESVPIKRKPTKTTTKTVTATQTVVSEKWIPQTTIIKEHWRTHFQDHWTTITPPVSTKTIVHTAYMTTVTLPAQTNEHYHYLPCRDDVILIKHIGRLAILAWCILLGWLYRCYRLKQRQKLELAKQA